VTAQRQLTTSLDTPVFAVPDEALVPVNDFPSRQLDIPQSKMFVIKKSLDAYKAANGANAVTYDASQGDGGASLPGVPKELLDRANELQKQKGTGYDMPYGTDAFRKATAEQYWKFEASTGYGPANICGVDGGRDGLIKAYQVMTTLGTGRVGDALLVSRVPWISYNWGPYGVGQNVLLAPGREEDGWEYTEDGLAASVEFCARNGGRKLAGVVITTPDNPTGRTLSMERQIALGKKALSLGIPFVVYDWIYHQVTSTGPSDINALLNAFTPEERKKLIILDGLTKSLGASNIRSAHLVASDEVCKFIISRASHGIVPNFYGQAVALAAYEVGFAKAAESIIKPCNDSRELVKKFLTEKGYKHVIGDGGYYTFINCAPAIEKLGVDSSEEFGSYLAQQYGIAVIPGKFFSDAGWNWIRFSYALPPEITAKALERFDEGYRAAL
jgi:aspartate aminotransferase